MIYREGARCSQCNELYLLQRVELSGNKLSMMCFRMFCIQQRGEKKKTSPKMLIQKRFPGCKQIQTQIKKNTLGSVCRHTPGCTFRGLQKANIPSVLEICRTGIIATCGCCGNHNFSIPDFKRRKSQPNVPH